MSPIRSIDSICTHRHKYIYIYLYIYFIYSCASGTRNWAQKMELLDTLNSLRIHIRVYAKRSCRSPYEIDIRQPNSRNPVCNEYCWLPVERKVYFFLIWYTNGTKYLIFSIDWKKKRFHSHFSILTFSHGQVILKIKSVISAPETAIFHKNNFFGSLTNSFFIQIWSFHECHQISNESRWKNVYQNIFLCFVTHGVWSDLVTGTFRETNKIRWPPRSFDRIAINFIIPIVTWRNCSMRGNKMGTRGFESGTLYKNESFVMRCTFVRVNKYGQVWSKRSIIENRIFWVNAITQKHGDRNSRH